jgi:endonuclease/exonuclease/phosphatase family metal-dependent hydrolase
LGLSLNPKRWRFTGFYGYPKVIDRHLSWSLLKLLAQKSTLPWLLGGDFNEVLAGHEKWGGSSRNPRQINNFSEVVNFCSLQSIHSLGPQFTWRGIRHGDEILVRLDRFLSSSSWSDCFPASKAVNLKPSCSDHLPILIEIREFNPRKKRKKKDY